ncbi:ORF6N domain-containing protein [Lactobacillus sp. PSON]|uniref:ORF6N domain-containing protein n=1 Tax=Lactobacillus sp. PSON TaxID=3455454 RepID=UPI004042A72C
MNELKVLGTENVAGYQFTGIEGGFGKGKKAMLVPDIAKIHGQALSILNRSIVRNIDKFTIGLDLIDLLNASEAFRKFAKENGLITNNRVKHIYLLSERGYLKLLKIMDDDKAWDIYNEIVDNYFNMRAEIKHEATKYEKLMQLANLTSNEEMKEYLISKAAEEITGEIVDVPLGFSLFQMERELHISWTIIDYTANKLGLKAPISQRNKFGYWEPQDCGAYISYNWYATAAGYRLIRKELNQ